MPSALTAAVARAGRTALSRGAGTGMHTRIRRSTRHRRHVDAGAARTGRGDADDAEPDPGARIRAVGEAGRGVGVPGARDRQPSRRPARRRSSSALRTAGAVAAHAHAAAAARAIAGRARRAGRAGGQAQGRSRCRRWRRTNRPSNRGRRQGEQVSPGAQAWAGARAGPAAAVPGVGLEQSHWTAGSRR